jgi:hypothetical protein
VKFSYRQILASAAGAVLAAVILSFFGVEGTIIGVAIGSVAATTGSALVFQSIDRTNKAVKQAVVRAPESSLLRRLGGTNVAGTTESTPGDSSAPTEEATTSAAASTGGASEAESSGPAPTQQIATTSGPGGPAGNQPDSDGPADRGGSGPGGISWRVWALAVLGVFLITLLFVTVIELVAGKPLADIFGKGGGGTTVERIFENPTTTASTSSTTSTSTTMPSSNTTTSVGGSTTSTSGVGSSGVGSTSTTRPSSGTTTTTVPPPKSP